MIGAPDNNPSESIIGHGHIFNKHMSGVFKLEAIIMVFPGAFTKEHYWGSDYPFQKPLL